MPKGPLTRGERDTIRVCAASNMDAPAIAARLKRPVAVVQKELERVAGTTPAASPVPGDSVTVRGADPASAPDAGVRESPPAKPHLVLAPDGAAVALSALRSSPFWSQIAAAFDKKEQALYEVEWISWSEQLGEDVTHSERAQVHQAITYLILRNRNLRDQKGLRDRADECERGIRKVEQLHPDADDRPEKSRAKLAALAAEQRGVYADLKLKQQELDSITTRHQNLLENLKAQRTQRLDRIKERTKDFIGLVRMIAEDEDRRRQEGRRAELIKAATIKKAAELGRPRPFADGLVDRPLLNCDTVGSEDPAPGGVGL